MEDRKEIMDTYKIKNRNDRRTFLKKAIGASIVAATTTRSLYGQPSPVPQTVRQAQTKVLFVWGGWAGHEPAQCRDVFVPWLEEVGCDVTVSDTLDAYLDEALMESLDLIIQTWTMGTITSGQSQALLGAVRNGVGIAGWHGGIGDSFRDNTEYQFMVGGQWVAHPGGVIDYEVNIVDEHDPVTVGLKDFYVHSEQYYMHVDPNVKVLATTTFTGEHTPWIDGCIVPVVWKKMYGNGRVFYNSLGHGAADFEVYETWEITKRGILWAAESKHAEPEEWVKPVYPNR